MEMGDVSHGFLMPQADAPIRETMKVALEKHFGFKDFLDAQADVVEAILRGRDALVVMPTGGGKTLCYQLPALMREGVTIVVSPLIALMKDQLDALEQRGIPATLINSTLTLDTQRQRMRLIKEQAFKLVYVAPERFRSRSFLSALKAIPISLFAVDEAHCLSQWGHDFRPDYFRLGEVAEELGRPQIAAFTATATPEVRRDILERLGLRDPAEFIAGFARPNLSLTVRMTGNEAEKHMHLRRIIKENHTGIIYCATRKRVEYVAALLASWKIRHVAYHAGLSDQERESAQEAFIRREADVAVATNAFGMGIDRGDIRFVVHYEIPGSLEAYYQEIGRAGRDGEASACELFYLPADTRIQEFFLEGANPSLPFIYRLWHFLCAEADQKNEVHWTLKEMADRLDGEGGEMAVSAAISLLQHSGCIERIDVPGSRRRLTRILDPSLVELPIDEEALQEKAETDWAKWRRMTDFVKARQCRQEMILHYFGEAHSQPCGVCDNCRDPRVSAMRPPTPEEDVIVRKALSGVARMSYREGSQWKGRFGRVKIIQVLLGSRSQALVQARLHCLSTHGLLAHCGSAYLQALFRELEESGLVVAHAGRYPVVTLTPKGAEAMQGRQKYVLQWPELRAAREKSIAEDAVQKQETDVGDALDASQRRLFEKLRKKRGELAQKEKVRPYVIFSDQTLRAFARLQPQSVQAALRIKGVGVLRAERYFPQFLPLLKK